MRSHDTWRGEPYAGAIFASPEMLSAAIALANDALPDDDPCKITWQWVDDLREAYRNSVALARFAQDVGDEATRQVHMRLAERYYHYADALASYLPPHE